MGETAVRAVKSTDGERLQAREKRRRAGEEVGGGGGGVGGSVKERCSLS